MKVTLTLTRDEIERLDDLLRYDVDIPKALGEKMIRGYIGGPYQALMGKLRKQVRKYAKS